MLDSVAVILLVFMGLRDDRRSSGEPHTSLFRTRDPDRRPKKTAAPRRSWEFDGEGLRR